MAVNTPTLYGPAPTGGSQSTAKDAQTEGTLAAIVLQPVEQAPTIDADNNLTYVEVWKGPYGWAKGIYSYDPIDKSREQFMTSVRGEVQVIERFNPPNPGNDNAWYINNVQVRELEAGDHAEIRVTYNSRPITVDPGQWDNVLHKDNWTLDWQSYSVTPYAFCANEEHTDPTVEDYKPDPKPTAWRQHIEDFIQSPSGDRKKFEYNTLRNTKFRVLNDAERTVYKKIVDGKNAIYHFPVLKHHEEWNKTYQSLSVALSAEFPQILGNDIDHIVTTNSA